MGAFENLGQALRWLRSRQQRKQYEIADAAGITKAMLSAYETGKQNPSIETLEKILDALGNDLSDLHRALVLHQGGGPPDLAGAGTSWYASEAELHEDRGHPRTGVAALDLDPALAPEQEHFVRQMLEGFHGLLRSMVRHLETGTRRPGKPPGRPGPRRLEEVPPLEGGDDEE
jgi:transcriptional regulator with XRE-family HTH domain